MELKRINTNQIISITIIIITFFIAINVYKAHNREIAKLLSVRDIESKKNAATIRIGQLNSKLDNYKEIFHPLERRELISMISKIATANNIKITSIKPMDISSRAEGQTYTKAYFTLGIQADDYHHLGRFISKLENNTTMFFVESVSFRGGGSGSSQMFAKPKMLNMSLTINVIFFE